MKTYILSECREVYPNLWVLKDCHGIWFAVIGTVSALVAHWFISRDCGQPVFEDKYVYTFFNSDRSSCVFPSFEVALKEFCRDKRVNSSEGLARFVLGGDDV